MTFNAYRCILTLLTSLWSVVPLQIVAPPVHPYLQEGELLLTLEPDRATVAPGDILTVTVNVDNNRPAPVEELELKILFPSDVVAPQEYIITEELLPPDGRWEQNLTFEVIRDFREPLEAVVTVRYAEDDPEVPLTSTFTLLPPEPAPPPQATSPPPATAEPTPEPTPPPGALEEPETPTPEPGLLDGLIPGLAGVGALLVLGLVVILLLVAIILLLRSILSKKPPPEAPPPTSPPRPPGPHLSFNDKEGQIRQITLQETGLTLGRAADNDLIIDNSVPSWQTVSRHHARIYQKGGFWVFEDLNSLNGIYVNAQRTGRNLLRDGWQLGVGGVRLTFHTGQGEVSE